MTREGSAGVSVYLPVCEILRCASMRMLAPPIWPAQHTQEERKRESGKLQLIFSWQFLRFEDFTMTRQDFMSIFRGFRDSSIDWQRRTIGFRDLTHSLFIRDRDKLAPKRAFGRGDLCTEICAGALLSRERSKTSTLLWSGLQGSNFPPFPLCRRTSAGRRRAAAAAPGRG